MSLVMVFILLYIITFIAFFIFVYRGEKKDPTEETFNLFMVFTTAAMLALIPTFVIGLFLFAILGSTNLMTSVFSFEISIKSLVVLSVAYLAYLFTVDSIIETFAEYLFGKERILIPAIFILIIRTVIFIGIGELVGLDQYSSIIMAIGVAVIVMVLEVLYLKSKRKKETES